MPARAGLATLVALGQSWAILASGPSLRYWAQAENVPVTIPQFNRFLNPFFNLKFLEIIETSIIHRK
jgi:hypothetical protein